MRLAYKFTLAFLVATTPILAARGFYFGRDTIERRERDSRSDIAMLSGSYSQAASRLWDVQGEQAAMELIFSARGSPEGTSVRWVPLDRPDSAVPDSVRAALAQGRSIDRLDPNDNATRHYVPVLHAGRAAAGLEVRHPLGSYRQSANEVMAELPSSRPGARAQGSLISRGVGPPRGRCRPCATRTAGCVGG